MSNTLLQGVLVGVVSGAVAASATYVVVSGGADSAGSEASAVAPTPVAAPTKADSGSLDGLRAEIAMLTSRIRDLEARPVASAREPIAAPSDGQVAASPEVEALVAALSTPGRPAPEGLVQSIQQVLDDREAAEEAEREQRRDEFFENQLNERMERYTTELGLDTYQQDEMRGLLRNERVRRDELFTAARETGEWTDMRESMREIRDELDTGLSALLTPDQMERYEGMERRGGLRGFGGGGGGDDGGGRGRRGGR